MPVTRQLAIAALSLLMAAAPAFAADPTGYWQTTGGESRYKVSYCGDGEQLCAKLTWLRKDAQTAENLAYLNRYVVKGAEPADADTWEGEVNYAGETFAGSLEMTSSNSLKLSGCKGVFCKTMVFNRLQEVAKL